MSPKTCRPNHALKNNTCTITSAQKCERDANCLVPQCWHIIKLRHSIHSWVKFACGSGWGLCPLSSRPHTTTMFNNLPTSQMTCYYIRDYGILRWQLTPFWIYKSLMWVWGHFYPIFYFLIKSSSSQDNRRPHHEYLPTLWLWLRPLLSLNSRERVTDHGSDNHQWISKTQLVVYSIIPWLIECPSVEGTLLLDC